MTPDVPVQFIVAAKPDWWIPTLQLIGVPIVVALVTLMGVRLTNIHNDRRSNREIAQRRAEQRKEEDRLSVIEESERSLSGLKLAVLIENFASHCADVVVSQSVIRWKGHEEDFDHYPDRATWLSPLPAWPDDLNWRLVGTAIFQDAQDLKLASEFALAKARDNSIFDDREGSHRTAAESAASLGLEAWALAAKIRKETGLRAVRIHDDYDPAVLLMEGQTRLAKDRQDRGRFNPSSDTGV